MTWAGVRSELALAWPQTLNTVTDELWAGWEARLSERDVLPDEAACAIQKIAESGEQFPPGWGQVYRISRDRCGGRTRRQAEWQRQMIARQRAEDEAARGA